MMTTTLLAHFNPRTPVGCDLTASNVYMYALISIHAPQWGATRKWATTYTPYHPFQSTHPSGVRLTVAPFSTICATISIHAPQWGATLKYRQNHTPKSYFNPRTPVGCDLRRQRSRLPHPWYVNPRTPVGCDRRWCSRWCVSRIFQSTHPSGVRPGVERPFGQVGEISIHAPQWGATLARFESPQKQQISIHAPQWGATCTISQDTARVTYFNPRTPVGCDHTRVTYTALRTISIHAPQWGATRRLLPPFDALSYFNPRTPVGCDDISQHTIPFIKISIHAPQWGATA